jgi:membrane protein YdbS with pleckstrin-like domain
MYSSFRESAESWLRIPSDPQPPPGDEGSTRLFRAAPAYYKYLLCVWALRTLTACFVVTTAMIGPVVGAVVTYRKGQDAGLWLLLIPAVAALLLIVFSIVALALVRLDFEKRWYVVTDRSLRVREGIVVVKEMTVTFANIQNIAISQGPIQRLLGIADLRVETAGGAAPTHGKHPGQSLHTAWIRGVNNASEVRQIIQDRLRQFKDAGLGDLDDVPLAQPTENGVMSALRELHRETCALRETVVRNTDVHESS